MSIAQERNYKFLTLKELGKSFKFYVEGHKEMTTKFGTSRYLIGERIQIKPKDKQIKGLLRVSATTIGSIGDVGKVQHLDEIVQKILVFEYSEEDRTVICTEVEEWSDAK